jgi:CDP-diacylglycerol--serine O-phosphatidyltransferase
MKKELVVPNFITIMALFCGFYSIIATEKGDYDLAAYAILAAFLFDGIDGKIARLMNATSDFGIQLDSLSDLVSFGIAPAILLYKWLLMPYGRLGWMAAFLFVACGALRLARFNIQTKRIPSSFFIGLPIPAAAGLIASSLIFVKHLTGNPANFSISISYVFMIYILAFLMVSNFPYFSFKKIDFHGIKTFNIMVIFVLTIFVVGLYPEMMLFLLFTLYALSGLLLSLLKVKRTKETLEESRV